MARNLLKQQLSKIDEFFLQKYSRERYELVHKFFKYFRACCSSSATRLQKNTKWFLWILWLTLYVDHLLYVVLFCQFSPTLIWNFFKTLWTLHFTRFRLWSFNLWPHFWGFFRIEMLLLFLLPGLCLKWCSWGHNSVYYS